MAILCMSVCPCVNLLLNFGEIGRSEAAWPGKLGMMLVT